MWLAFWYIISLAGSPYLWAAICGGLFIVYMVLRTFRRKAREERFLKRFLLILVPALVLTLLVTASMKSYLALERPCIPCPGEGCNPYCPLDASFPSGHAATIFSVFTCLCLLSGKRKLLAIFIIPVLVGLSRIMLDVHTYPDVIAGALIGIAIPVLVVAYDKWAFEKY